MKRIAGIPLIILGNVISQIINFFKNRVAADGGVFEAETCLEADIVRLRNLGVWDEIRFILTPNAYKASKIYSLLPGASGDVTFTRASTRLRRNSSGFYETINNNIPPFEYPVGGGCPFIAADVQRTNLCVRSFQVASWNGVGATGTNSTSTSPEGANTAGTIVLNSGGYFRAPFFSLASSTTYAISCFVKNIGLTAGQTFRFYVNNNSGTGLIVSGTVNLVAGTFVLFSSTGTTGASASIINDGNGWLRIVLIFTSNAGTVSATSEIGFDTINIPTGSFLVWGAQIEVGNYASSPIITSGSSVTRVSDALNGVVSFSGNVGTIIIDIAPSVSAAALNNVLFTCGDIQIRAASTNSWELYYDNANKGGYTASKTARAKFAISFNGTQVKVFRNGVFVASPNDRAAIAAPTTFSITPANSAFQFPVYEVLTFDSVLSDARLIALTS